MIVYRFTFDDGQYQEFTVDPERRFNPELDIRDHPSWTRLTFNQCRNCPLHPQHLRHCPAAVDSAEVVQAFRNVISYTTATVEVTTEDRTYIAQCDLQTALRSLLGLVMATSACPILSRLRGLARTHLPFASMNETLFRTAGAYLLQQYRVHKAGGQPDWDLRGLDAFFLDLQTLNQSFKARLDSISEQDANLNAIGALIQVSAGISLCIEDRLDELRGYTLDTPRAF